MTSTLELLKKAPLYNFAEEKTISLISDVVNKKNQLGDDITQFTRLDACLEQKQTSSQYIEYINKAKKLFQSIESESIESLKSVILELEAQNLLQVFNFNPYIAKILNLGYIEELLVPIMDSCGVSGDIQCMILHYACCSNIKPELMYGLLDLILLENRRFLQPKEHLILGIKKLMIEEIRIILKFMSLHWRTTQNSVHWIDCITKAISSQLMNDLECLKHLSHISSYFKQSIVHTKKQLQMLGTVDTIIHRKKIPQKHTEYQYKIYTIPDKIDHYYKENNSEDIMEIEEEDQKYHYSRFKNRV